MEYFRKVDEAVLTLLDLLTDEIQFYVPKFGVGYGRAAVAEAASGLNASLRAIEHDFDRMNIMTSGDHVIIEGFERGISADGLPRPDPERSEGRYCNVFEFRALLIKCVHIDVDPDFRSTDRARFLWGDKVRRARPTAAS